MATLSAMEALEPDIVLPGRSASPSPAVTTPNENAAAGPVVCALCLAAPGKYTCPRCNAPYCSLACYKGARHSACSELFYRESVLQALQEEDAGSGGRRQMEEMLLRLREEESCLEEEKAELWGSLTQQEKEHFNTLLKSGHIGSLVPRWKPWWDAQQLPGIMELAGADPLPGCGQDDGTQQPRATICAGSQRDEEAIAAPERVASPPGKIEGAQETASHVVKEKRDSKITCEEMASHVVKEKRDSKITCEETASHVVKEKRDSKITCEETASHVVKEKRDSKITCEETASHVLKEKRDSKITCEETAPEDDASAQHEQPESSSIAGSEDPGDGLRAEPGAEDQYIVSEIPPLLSSIPPLCSLTRRPSPLLRFTLVNVLYGYTFSLLRHNGDLSDGDLLLDFIGTLMSISGALSTNTVYNSTAHALKSAVRAASDPLVGGDQGVAVLAMEATAKILGDGSKRFSLAALSHLYRLLGKVHKLVTEEEDLRKGAFMAKRKCLFLVAWVKEQGDCLAVLSAEVMMEYEQYLKDLNEMAEISNKLQRVWGGKRPPAKKELIQEVN